MAALAIFLTPSIPAIILKVWYVDKVMKSQNSAIVLLNVSVLVHLTGVITYLILHSQYRSENRFNFPKASHYYTYSLKVYEATVSASFWVPLILAIIESILFLMTVYESKVCQALECCSRKRKRAVTNEPVV